MLNRVFVTGGSGFVGSAVIEELASRGHQIRALANRKKIESAVETQSVQGSLFDVDSLNKAMSGCDAVIHLVGIIMERPSKRITFERIHFQGTKNVVDAARRAGIKRYVQMSAIGARSGAVSNYHKTKFAAEEYVRNSGLEWTIFRPSMIHGPRGEFMQLEAKWARRQAPPFLFMPYFGGGIFGQKGAGKIQPVFVNDVARAFVDALENRKTIGEVYQLGGSEQMTWPQMHKTISTQIVGHPRATLPIPVWAAKFYAAMGIARLLGFNRDQIIMSQEENTCDLSKFEKDFGWEPRGFEESLKSYAARM